MITWKQLLGVGLVLCATAAPLRAQETFASPNKAFEVAQISLQGGRKQTIQLVAVHPRRVLFSWQKPARSIEVLWKADSGTVAVNSYTGNAGDAVHVIAVHGRTARLLRQPDDNFVRSLQAHYPVLKSVDRFTLAADRWEGDCLVMDCDGEARDRKDQLSKFKFEVRMDTAKGGKDGLVFGPLNPG